MANEELNQIGNVFIYFMILFSYFLTGFLFILLFSVVPLLIDGFNGTCNTDILNKFSEKNFNLIVYSSLALIVGMILKGISNIFSWIGFQVGPYFPKCLKLSKQFDAREFLKPEFAKKIVKLKKSEKMHWEWEVFSYSVHWGIFINFFIFSLLLLIGFFVFSSLKIWSLKFGVIIFVMLLINLLLFINSCYRSRILQAVYEGYFLKV